MTKYALIFTGGKVGSNQEETQQMLANWGVWYESIGDKLVDGGSAFMPNKTCMTVSQNGVMEGSSTQASGYTLIQADSKEEAVQIASNCPIVSDGGTVEVHEFMSFN